MMLRTATVRTIKAGGAADASVRARASGARVATVVKANVRGVTASSSSTTSSLVVRARALERGGGGSGDRGDGSGRGGRGGGGDDDGRGGGDGNGEDGDEFLRRLRGGGAAAIAMVTVHALSPAPARAKAQVTRQATQREAKVQNLATSVLYGFVFFYAIKVALKRFFAPMLLFTGTTQLLYNMRAVKISPMMLYDSFIKPYMPSEYQRSLNDFGDKAMNDSWWQKQERRFFTCAHRILPACDSPMGERALILGVLLAGLAG
jgi:hypothetical protein